MTVKELITTLLDFNYNETVVIGLDNERISDITEIENWHGKPIIIADDWRDTK